jgi:RHS repeat-associated protein
MPVSDPNQNQSQQGAGAQKSAYPLDQYTVAPKSGDSDEKSPYYQPSAPSIALPKGGGALKGIDEKFTVNAVNGTAGLQAALPFTPGRGGFTPSLGLSYNSGSGNSEFGLGWSLGLPAIQRKTDKRLPLYSDIDESDVFLMAGAEDLQPYLVYNTSVSRWEPVIGQFTEGGSHFTVKRYRPRIEGLYALIEYVIRAEGGSWWKVTTKDNMVTWYGADGAARVSDPEDENRIFKWLPQVAYDNKGNVQLYNYFTDDDPADIPAALHERNRINGNARYTNVYLKSVQYCNKAHYNAPLPASYDISGHMPDAGDFLMQMVLDYGDHSFLSPSPEPDLPMPFRVDPFSDFHACFEIRTYRRCMRAMMFHYFEELAEGDPVLVRTMDMEYSFLPSLNGYADASFLISLSETGFMLDGSGGYYNKTLPGISINYQELEWNGTLHNVQAADAENIPQGLTGPYQWIDLWGEGLPGIITEQADSWMYRRNMGDGHFAPSLSITPKPSFQGLGDNMQWQDLDADGRRQLVSRDGAMRGYFELNDDQQWESFKAFRENVNIDWSSPFTKMLDLNGDGRPDVLITEDQAWKWYENEGTEGIKDGGYGEVFYDEEKGPRLLLNDNIQVIFLADMNGDGITDLVRIQNGEVCYWPNMGYGRFGARVTMTDSPWFDTPDLFNPQYVTLSDIGGTGTADIIYIGKEKYTAWRNLAGNAWSEAKDIAPVPATEPYSKVAVMDFLGNGTACIVWSSPLPHNAWAPMRYIDLMGGKKPYLMTSYSTSLGKTVSLEYKQSTKYYLEDEASGHPWATRLPFPVHCVSKITTTDDVSQTIYTQQYSYHHGYYDHAEREFRGFGRVETIDTDEAIGFRTSPPGPNDLDQAPVLTKTWNHTGAWMQEDTLLRAFAREYYPTVMPSPPIHWPELPIDPDIKPAIETPAASLTPQELREAYRAMKGQPVRQEVYALDGSDQEEIPYTVATYAYCIQLVQPVADNRYSVSRSYQQQSLAISCERNPHDPRIMQELVLETDIYGNVLQSAKVAYPRTFTPSPLPPAQVMDTQSVMLVSTTKNTYTNDVLDDGYHLRVPCEVYTGELTGALPAATLWTPAELLAVIEDATHIAYTDVPVTSSPPVAQLRMLGLDRTLFYSDDLADVLDRGQLQPLAIPYQHYKLAFADDMMTSVDYYNNLITDLSILQQGGYLSTANIAQFSGDPAHYYWLPSGHMVMDPAHFFSPLTYVDPWGNNTVVSYWDESATNYYLLPKVVTDAVSNTTTVEAYNWYNLQPTRIKDANDNISTMLFDCLGMPVAMAVMGKDDGTEGDTLAGIDPNSSADIANQIAFFTDPESVAADLLAGATFRTVYYLDTTPMAVGMIGREYHHYGPHPVPSPPADNGRLIRLTYTDGLGRIAMHKVQAAPAEGETAIRWIGSGKTVYNNKGKAVMQYEPYFSTTPLYDAAEQAAAEGVTARLHYDPLGRVLRTDLPDGTYTKTEWDGWVQVVYDNNDTLTTTSPWYLAAMAGTPQQQDAATKALEHADTPTTMYLDTLGRPFFTVMHNRLPDAGSPPDWVDAYYDTYAVLDISGNRRAVYDARGLAAATPWPVLTWSYNLVGAPVKQVSADGGTNCTITTADNKPLTLWDANDHHFRYTYDAVRRQEKKIYYYMPTSEWELEKLIYGEGVTGAATLNLRGRIYKSYDGGGLETVPQYDFNGMPLSTTRQFTLEYTSLPEWNNPLAVSMEATIYTTSMIYDALGRPVTVTSPDGGQTNYKYQDSGLLYSIAVTGVHGLGTDIINEIYYDAKGQRQKVKYENGSTTTYAYDPYTFRVTNIRTTRSSDNKKLQDLKYWYDPVGNITLQTDGAVQDVYFNNTVVTPDNDYTYDALYRLIIASGRENAGNGGAPTFNDSTRMGFAPLPADPLAMQRYTEKYTYDEVGNMLQMRHIAPGGSGWTRTFTIDATSNRTLSNSIGSNDPVLETYTYDNAGNITGGFNHMPYLSYDYCNRLNLIGSDDMSDSYQYDRNGQRIRKTSFNGSTVNVEMRKYIGPWEDYIVTKFFVGYLVSQRQTLNISDDTGRMALIDTPIVDPTGSEVQLLRYQYSNHLGTATLELADDAAIISYEEYYPYGSTSYQSGRSAAETSLKRYRYIGKERDEITGFYYMGARYYVSWMARWIAVDPLEAKYTPESSYNYCHNNPIGWTDRTGMAPTKKKKETPAATNGQQTTIGYTNMPGATRSTGVNPTPATSSPQPSQSFSPGIVTTSIGPVYDSPTPDKVITKDQEYEAHEHARATLFANAILQLQARGSGVMSQERTMTPDERRENDRLNKEYLWEHGYFYDGTKRPLKALAESPEFNSFAEKLFDVTSLVDGAEGILALKAAIYKGSTSLAINTAEHTVPILKTETTTVYRNFGWNEYKTLRESGNNFVIGSNFGSKQFWLDKEGIDWWTTTPFSKNFTAKITVNNSALSHGTTFLDAGKYNAISFDSQEALDVFNKNMKIEWIQYK